MKQRSLGHLPATWARQDALLFVWPGTGFEDTDAARRSMAELIRTVAADQPVLLVCGDHERRADAERALGATADVEWLELPVGSSLMRLFGPQTVLMGDQPHLLAFQSRAGALGPWSPLERHFSQQLHGCGRLRPDIRISRLNFELSPAAVETNGDDSLLMHRGSIPERIGTPRPMEAMLTSFFRHRHVLWLEADGPSGDASGGRVDLLARFVGRQCIAHVDDPALATEIAALRDPDDRPFQRLALPRPERPVAAADGSPLPASYTQFLVTNERVIVPAFADPADEPARRLLADAFPEREVISLDARALTTPLGALHVLGLPLVEGMLQPAGD